MSMKVLFLKIIEENTHCLGSWMSFYVICTAATIKPSLFLQSNKNARKLHLKSAKLYLKIPFFWMLRLLAAKFSRSARVPADRVECILADTDSVDPRYRFYRGV